MGKAGALISAAGLSAVLGAFAISLNALAVYLGTDDGSPASAKVVAAISVHVLATAVIFVIACIVGATAYLLLSRFGWANYVSVGILGLAVGLFAAPTVGMALGGLVAGLIFHWRYCAALNSGQGSD